LSEENDKIELLPYFHFHNVETNINRPMKKNLSDQNDSNDSGPFNFANNNEQVGELNPENISVLNHEMTFTDSQEESKNILIEEINIGKKKIKIEEESQGKINDEKETLDLSSFDSISSLFGGSLIDAIKQFELPEMGGVVNKKDRIFVIIKQNKKGKNKTLRKDDEDNIRKKFQGYAFKWIKSKLNIELRKNNNPFEFEFDFSQSMTTNVSIQKNKIFLNMTIKELLIDKYEYEKKEDKKACNIFIAKNNKKIIQFLIDKNIENIVTILEKKLKFVYIEYIESESFKIKVKKLGKKFDNKYITKYIKVAKNLVKYYEEKIIRKK